MNQKLIKISAIFLIIVLIGAGVFFYLRQEREKTKQRVADKILGYVNQNFLKGAITASLVGIWEENGVYKIKLKVKQEENDVFATKNGKLLFIAPGINLDEKPVLPEEPKKLTCEEIKKAEKSLLEVFVVSKCPFGLQAQRILNEIIKNIPNLADRIKVKYIVAMHGEEEARENLRQICLREEQGNKYWDYINCHLKEGNIENCLVESKTDLNKLEECAKNKGLEYAKKDFESQEKYKITGSPSLILNGEKVNEFDFGGRTAEAIKTLLCCGFNSKPDFCSQKLSEEQAAVGFSKTYINSSQSANGSCK
jgi:glutaredoxin